MAPADSLVIREDGIEGDSNRTKRTRKVTVIDRAAWESACADVGATIDPSYRRANVLTEGIDLSRLEVGDVIMAGVVALRVEGETTPCPRMDEACDGLQGALKPAMRGGVYCTILTPGVVRLGDIALVEARAATGAQHGDRT